MGIYMVGNLLMVEHILLSHGIGMYRTRLKLWLRSTEDEKALKRNLMSFLKMSGIVTVRLLLSFCKL